MRPVDLNASLHNKHLRQSVSLKDLLAGSKSNDVNDYLSLSFLHYKEATKISITSINGTPTVYTAIVPVTTSIDPYALQFFPR